MEESPLLQTRLVIASRAQHLPQVREIIEASARQIAFTQRDIQRIVTAVYEAVTNAALHGSPDGAKDSIEVCVRVFADKMVVEVADKGPGFESLAIPEMPGTDSNRGRGLPLMRALMDEVQILNSKGGRVVLTKFVNPRSDTVS